MHKEFLLLNLLDKAQTMNLDAECANQLSGARFCKPI